MTVAVHAAGQPTRSADHPARTPLEAWIAARVGRRDGCLDLAELAVWQLARLNETLSRARRLSPFYAESLADFGDGGLGSLEEMRELPFTSADDLRREGPRLLCVRLDEVERIVTVPTSGTTGAPKRIYFSGSDQELTVDFFHHGMSTFTRAGDHVLVLMPGERPGSVGELLARALPRLGATVTVHGPVRDRGRRAGGFVRDEGLQSSSASRHRSWPSSGTASASGAGGGRTRGASER